MPQALARLKTHVDAAVRAGEQLDGKRLLTAAGFSTSGSGAWAALNAVLAVYYPGISTCHGLRLSQDGSSLSYALPYFQQQQLSAPTVGGTNPSMLLQHVARCVRDTALYRERHGALLLTHAAEILGRGARTARS